MFKLLKYVVVKGNDLNLETLGWAWRPYARHGRPLIYRVGKTECAFVKFHLESECTNFYRDRNRIRYKYGIWVNSLDSDHTSDAVRAAVAKHVKGGERTHVAVKGDTNLDREMLANMCWHRYIKVRGRHGLIEFWTENDRADFMFEGANKAHGFWVNPVFSKDTPGWIQNAVKKQYDDRRIRF